MPVPVQPAQSVAFDILQKSTRCFCKVPLDDLLYWAHKRYVERIPTITLLSRAPTSRDRELISVVALLDVEPAVLDQAVGHRAKPGCRLEQCRQTIRFWLAHRYGVHVERPSAC